MIDTKQLLQYGHGIIIILMIVSLGLYCINSFLSYTYKNQFLQGPCELCVKLNPDWQTCYDNSKQMKNYSYTPPQFNFSLVQK
jgi:hypothetical protein